MLFQAEVNAWKPLCARAQSNHPPGFQHWIPAPPEELGQDPPLGQPSQTLIRGKALEPKPFDDRLLFSVSLPQYNNGVFKFKENKYSFLYAELPRDVASPLPGSSMQLPQLFVKGFSDSQNLRPQSSSDITSTCRPRPPRTHFLILQGSKPLLVS